MATGTRTHLTLYLTSGYLLLIIYGSLHPLSGWRDSGGDPFAFLGAAWPRYYTGFDLTTNVLAYLPFGFLCAVNFARRIGPWSAWLLAALLGSSLSFSMELVQNYLPSRVPSNLDLACNSVGALIGSAVGARLSPQVFNEWRLARGCRNLMQQAYGADLGVLLICAWLVSQFSLETLLFGNGNLRRVLDLPQAQSFLPERFAGLEAAVAAAGLLAAALVINLLLRRHTRLLTASVLLVAVLIKTLSYALYIGPADMLSWITPGNRAGMIVGLALWWSASFLSSSVQRAVAALALLFTTVMVNLGPENPYLVDAMSTWNPGQLLNVNGLTRLISSLWPFFALPWLMIYRPEKS